MALTKARIEEIKKACLEDPTCFYGECGPEDVLELIEEVTKSREHHVRRLKAKKAWRDKHLTTSAPKEKKYGR